MVSAFLTGQQWRVDSQLRNKSTCLWNQLPSKNISWAGAVVIGTFMMRMIWLNAMNAVIYFRENTWEPMMIGGFALWFWVPAMPTIRSDLTLIDVMGGIFLTLIDGLDWWAAYFNRWAAYFYIFGFSPDFQIFPVFSDFPRFSRFSDFRGSAFDFAFGSLRAGEMWGGRE
jgi:hypothetical protein